MLRFQRSLFFIRVTLINDSLTYDLICFLIIYFNFVHFLFLVLIFCDSVYSPHFYYKWIIASPCSMLNSSPSSLSFQNYDNITPLLSPLIAVLKKVLVFLIFLWSWENHFTSMTLAILFVKAGWELVDAWSPFKV